MKKRRHRFRNFLRRSEGVAYIETAIALPLLFMLFIGTIELTRYVIIIQKVQKATNTISDLVAQEQSVTVSGMNNLVLAATQVMQPYTFGQDGYVIVSSVSRAAPAAPVVKWQYISSGASGSWTQPTQVGLVNATATLPGGLTLDDKENIIVAEVYYNFRPLMGTNVLSGATIYKNAVFKPRFGTLTTLGTP